MADFDPIGLAKKYGGAILGGLLGFAGSGNTTTGATQSRDPWAPAQPFILKNLQNESDLQGYYQKTPFNQQQQQGYSNLFGDIGNFRDNVAPGLMDFANKGMTGGYQRQRGSVPGSVGYGAQPDTERSPVGPFSMARGAQVQSPMLDLNGAMNPYTNGAIKPAEQKAYEAMTGGLLGGSAPKSGGNGGPAVDHNPNWTAMGDVEKANYYADNPTMASVTKLLQLGFSLTDIAKIQQQAEPGFVQKQKQIANGDAFGGSPAFGNFNLGDSMNGLGMGDISQLGVNLGQFGDADTINSIAYGYDGGMFNSPSSSIYGGNIGSDGDGSVGGYSSNSYGGAASSEGGYGGYGGSDGGYGGYGGSGGFGGIG